MGILGFILMIILVVLGIRDGSELGSFIDIPSFLLTVGCSFFALLACFGGQIGRAIKVVFSSTTDRETLSQSIAVYQRWQTLAIAAGVLGALIGYVNMLANLDEISALTSGSATALITVFYGFFMAYCILQPIVVSLQKRLRMIE